MGLFGKKKEAKEQRPIEEVMAQNVFGKVLLPGEKIDYCIQGKGQAEKLIFFNVGFGSNGKTLPIF